MSDHFQKEIAFLGIESSPAFVPAPEGNGCAERFIRAEGESALGAIFRNDRTITSGVARVPRHLQHHMDDRAAWISHARAVSSQAASIDLGRSVGFNPNRGRYTSGIRRFARPNLLALEVAAIRDRREIGRAHRRLRLFGHRRKLALVIADIGDLVRHDQVMLRPRS